MVKKPVCLSVCMYVSMSVCRVLTTMEATVSQLISPNSSNYVYVYGDDDDDDAATHFGYYIVIEYSPLLS